MVNKRNLLKLAKVLESDAAQRHFDMGSWLYNNTKQEVYDFEGNRPPMREALTECKTTACMAGWAAAIAKPKAKLTDFEIKETAIEWLGLGPCEAGSLFTPYGYLGVNDPKLAAKVVRHLANTGVVDWSVIDGQ